MSDNSPLQRYQDAEGHVFSMTKEDADKAGYKPVKPAPQSKAVSGPPENK